MSIGMMASANHDSIEDIFLFFPFTFCYHFPLTWSGEIGSLLHTTHRSLQRKWGQQRTIRTHLIVDILPDLSCTEIFHIRGHEGVTWFQWAIRRSVVLVWDISLKQLPGLCCIILLLQMTRTLGPQHKAIWQLNKVWTSFCAYKTLHALTVFWPL